MEIRRKWGKMFFCCAVGAFFAAAAFAFPGGVWADSGTGSLTVQGFSTSRICEGETFTLTEVHAP